LRPVVEPGRDRLAIVILLVISLVLLIPCANVVGILLAQGEARRREFAMRVAMGASRRRLVQHVIAESLWLGLAAAALGLLMAHWMIRALTAFQPAALPVTLNLDLRIDGRVLAYTLLLALVTALAAGLAPALRFSRPDLMPALKGEAPGAVSRFWFRGGLIIAQIAFSQFCWPARACWYGAISKSCASARVSIPVATCSSRLCCRTPSVLILITSTCSTSCARFPECGASVRPRTCH